MGKKYSIDGKPRKSGAGKFFLGLLLGFVMCVATLIGFGWFTYENISVQWLNDTFNIGLDLGSQDLNNKTVKEIVASARNLADKINTYTLNDLDKDFGISVGDKVIGIDVNDLKDVPVKELDVAVQEKINCISADELKDAVDLSEMDLILNKTYTFYVYGDKLYEDAEHTKEVDSTIVKYNLTSTTVEIKSQTRTIQDNKADFEFRFLPLTKAVGYLKTTMGDKITIGDLIDKEKGFGVNLPSYLCDTAEKRNKTINQLEGAIDDLTLAEFLGYTISGNDVYNGGSKVSGIVAKLAKKKISELKNVEGIIKDSTIAEVFDYTFEGGKYYYNHSTNGKTEVTGIMKALAGVTVNELTEEVENMSILKALGYTAYTKADGITKGYKDENGNEVTGALTIIDLETTKITEIATELQDAINEKTLAQLAAAGVINVSETDLAKTIKLGTHAGKTLGSLYINQVVEALVSALQ